MLLATGASPRIPPVEGRELSNVLSLTRLEAAAAIRSACQEGRVGALSLWAADLSALKRLWRWPTCGA
ncbi:hypothetical protein AGMMS50248_00470 [Deltaproteobacteria bacterium]|nr:hypothetical protein AGMMS50248_00470 [Deltaproteobacteria bacterium]